MTQLERVEKEWALPNLAEVENMEPFGAFGVFFEYQQRAMDTRYMDELRDALLQEFTGTIGQAMDITRPTKRKRKTAPPVEQDGILKIRLERGGEIPKIEELEMNEGPRIDREIALRLPQRVAPLLPAIRGYVAQRKTDPITATRLSWLVDGLRKPQTADLEDGVLDWLNTYNKLKREYYDGLIVIAKEFTEVPQPYQPEPVASKGTSTTQGNIQPIVWKGQPAELYELFENLVGNGWIELPKKRGKRSRAELARAVHASFAFSSGTNLEVGTAINYLKKGKYGINEQRPVPRVSFPLKKNPDVGDGYDPDKAGE